MIIHVIITPKVKLKFYPEYTLTEMIVTKENELF
jgi:hypothetical protein